MNSNVSTKEWIANKPKLLNGCVFNKCEDASPSWRFVDEVVRAFEEESVLMTHGQLNLRISSIINACAITESYAWSCVKTATWGIATWKDCWGQTSVVSWWHIHKRSSTVENYIFNLVDNFSITNFDSIERDLPVGIWIDFHPTNQIICSLTHSLRSWILTIDHRWVISPEPKSTRSSSWPKLHREHLPR